MPSARGIKDVKSYLQIHTCKIIIDASRYSHKILIDTTRYSCKYLKMQPGTHVKINSNQQKIIKMRIGQNKNK